MKDYKISNLQNIVFSISLIVLKLIVLNIMISVYRGISYVNVLLVISIILIFSFKYKEFKFLKIDKDYKASLIVSVIIMLNISKYFYLSLPYFVNKIYSIINLNIDKTLFSITITCLSTIISFISLYYIINFMLYKSKNKIKEFYNTLTLMEKKYIIGATVILSLFIIIIYSQTNEFYKPIDINNELQVYDVVYTSDTGEFIRTDTYMNLLAPQNDIRQPLFAIAAFPFAVIAKIISLVLRLIPIIPTDSTYAIGISIMHIMILTFIGVLLSRMISKDNIDKILFLIIYTLSYPFMLFSINPEQYVIHMFYLILLIYLYINNIKNGIGYIYILSTGSLLTSGVMIPLLWDKAKSIIDNIKYIWKKFLLTIFIFIFSGTLPLLLNGFNSASNMLNNFTGDLSLYDKLIQFINFIRSIFIYPLGYVEGPSSRYLSTYSYQMQQVNSISIIGSIILILVIIGFILNYKKRFAQICMGWVLFSFILLCLIGWGTKENGLILYSIYFSWAYISLFYMAISKLLSKYEKLKYIVIGLLSIGILFLNVREIYTIVQFGIEYYPVIR